MVRSLYLLQLIHDHHDELIREADRERAARAARIAHGSQPPRESRPRNPLRRLILAPR